MCVKSVTPNLERADQAVQWLGQHRAEPGKAWMSILSILGPTSGCAFLRSKLVDERCQDQSPVMLVDLAIRSFPVVFSETHVNMG